MRSFIEPDLFENNVPFDNTTLIYLINLLCKLGLRLGLDIELYYFGIFHREVSNPLAAMHTHSAALNHCQQFQAWKQHIHN